MALKMYINGTPGGTDGTEITTLTIKNLMSYMKGDTETASYNGFAIVPICLREESGYKASSVTVNPLTVANAKVLIASIGASWPTNGFSLYDTAQSIGELEQTNKMFYLYVSASAAIASDTNLCTISYVEDAS